MTGSIFLLDDEGGLQSLQEQAYISEDRLQSLLEQHPQLLAGEQMRPEQPRRWILVSREFGVPSEEDGGNRWSIDHLFLDQDGIPTLVEVKRSTDSRIRREVVGQMLDYAANGLVYWPPDSIRQKYESRCRELGLDPEQELGRLAGEDTAYDEYWHRVKTNLQAGRVRLVFVADQIPSELRRIVEFLNGQMDPAEVLAVEVKQYAGDGVRTLVPRVFGLTAEAQRAKGTGKPERVWNEESFFAELERNADPAEVAAARELHNWAQRNSTRLYWGRGSRYGTLVPIVEHKGMPHQMFAIWTLGHVELYFYWYARKPPFNSEELRREFADRLGAVPGINLPDDAIERRPPVPLSVLTEADAMKAFEAAFEWYVEQVRAT